MTKKADNYSSGRISLRFRKYAGLYVLLAPVLVWMFIFCYVPMYGAIIAFKEYRFLDGIIKSPWADQYGFKYFIRFFESYQSLRVLGNTIIISFYKLIFAFPAPIILALLLNEVRNLKFKRIVQTMSYLPHFMSWIVISALIIEVLNPVNGLLNAIIVAIGGKSTAFLMEPKYFRTILVLSSIWKEIGWGSIVYLAAISSIDVEMYEAADIDGASRFRKAWSITLPSIIPVIVILFILRIGGFLNAGFDEVLNLYNPAVYDVGDIIDTYVYRVGLQDMRFSYSAAIGLFKNVIGAILLVFTNIVTKAMSGSGIW